MPYLKKKKESSYKNAERHRSISISLSDKTNYAFVNNLTGAHFISEHHGYKKVNTNKYFTSSIPIVKEELVKLCSLFSPWDFWNHSTSCCCDGNENWTVAECTVGVISY